MIHLLIVDDEGIFRSGLRSLIEEQYEDIMVSEAANGLEAMHIILNEHIDGMFVDINMPKMNGLELLETLNEQNVPKIPSIIISGYDSFEYARRAIKNEVCDYLLKPLTPDEAAETVTNLISVIKEHREDEIIIPKRDDISEEDSLLIIKIKTYISEHYMDDISIAGIADVLKYNANYISQVFRNETGQKLVEYLRCFRIEKAKELLKNSDMKVTEIGSSVGIPNSQYFCTVFRALAGMTPQDYREKSNKN